MNRLRARVSKVLAVAAAFAACGAVAGAQERAPALWFQGTRLVLEHPVPMSGDLAVTTRDSGLRRFLDRLGATISFDARERYVVVTAADRRTITFTLGDAAYLAGGVRGRAAFAPFADGADAAVPFYTLARALYVEPVPDGGETVLQPRIGAIDVRPDGARTIVTVRGAMPLITAAAPVLGDRVSVTFVGQGTALASSRAGGFDVTFASGGTVRVPTTTLTIAARGASAHVIAPDGPDAYTLALDGRAGAPVAAAPSGAPPSPPSLGMATAMPTPMPYAAATAVPNPGASIVPPVVLGRPSVTDVAISRGADDALLVDVALSGTTTYEWHRLLDHRWYLDLLNTTMTGPGRDEHPAFGTAQGIRVRQTGTTDAPSVRIAFTFADDQRIDITPSSTGLRLTVSSSPPADVARAGRGSTGGPELAASAASPDPSTSSDPAAWKYAPASANPRLIVIDPGHGGGDSGAQHNGLVEKSLTLDIAQRLRALLTAAGWQVKMTREGDADPISPALLAQMRADGKPNADDRAYLQTRCDVANAAGARMFISIHINSAPTPSARGTTTYWYKPQDAALAQAIQRAVTGSAGTQDDGVRHENFYVVRHATMPAVLLETAFLTNAGDVALLRSADFLDQVARGIAAGVRAYAGSPGSSAVSASASQ